MLYHLKVKIKALAAESIIIRHAERKALRKARWLSTARKSNINPAWQQAAYSEYHDLHDHRINKVRTTARSAQLAYAYICGQPYRSVERPGSTTPNWIEVKQHIKRFGSFDEAKFTEWMNGQTGTAKG